MCFTPRSEGNGGNYAAFSARPLPRLAVSSLFWFSLPLSMPMPSPCTAPSLTRLGAPSPTPPSRSCRTAKLSSSTQHRRRNLPVSDGASGRFYVLAGGKSFRELTTSSFYGGEFDSVEQNIVLEPEWVRQSIVVTATGLPQPQAQVSASVSVINKTDFLNNAIMVDPLRQVPGFDVVQTGQRGGLTSVFIRGGNSDANKVLLDGVSVEDIGGRFDLSPSPAPASRTSKPTAGPTAFSGAPMPPPA